jgi:hypothetical protein
MRSRCPPVETYSTEVAGQVLLDGFRQRVATLPPSLPRQVFGQIDHYTDRHRYQEDRHHPASYDGAAIA